MKKLIAFIVVIINCQLSIVDSYAQSGSLDNTFNGTGIVMTNLGPGDAYGRSVIIQSDGKIVVAGARWNGSDNDFAIIRYNSNGSLDTGFDTDGKVTTAIGSGNDYGRSVAIQSDGKIVVAGESENGVNYNFAVIRYNTDGSLDNTFGTGGKVNVDIGSGDDYGRSVAIQSDGKIIVAGYASIGSQNDFAVVRFNSDGSLDSSFGTGGKVTTNSGMDDHGNSVAIQSDGKIVVAGGNSSDFVTIRYNSDGSLDNSFGFAGIITTNFDGINDDEIYSVAIQPDGKIIVAGLMYSIVWNYDNIGLARYNNDGSLDITFDGDGKVITNIPVTTNYAYAVALQSDGKLVVSGRAQSTYDFAVLRYNSDGSLDNTFDSDGIVTTAPSITDDAYSVAIQSDGKIVVAGASHNGSNSYFAVARYNNNVIGINTIANRKTEVKIFPNPFSSSATLRITKLNELQMQDLRLVLYNLTGQEITPRIVSNLDSFVISRDNLPEGLYFYKISNNKEPLANGKIVIADK